MANRNPKNLPQKAPGKHCNAATPTGYCKNLAGFKTDHLHEGRCYLHGGASDGRPIVNGYYSRKVSKNLRDQLIEITNDPQFSTMFEEFAQLKMVLGNVLSGLPEDFGEDLFNREVNLCKKCGGDIHSETQAKKRVDMLVKLIEKLSKVHKRIIETSIMANKVITMDQLQYLYKQIAQIIFEATDDEDVAEEVFDKLQKIPLFFRS